jgi:hypothetical protein
MKIKKMTENTDHNAILLQVMAHDLLAPLTAIKWQVELLEKNYSDKEKRERYLKGLAESTELGIALSKHAHVAGKVLSHSYEGDIEQAKLSHVVHTAVADMHLQYERHALVLKADITEEEVEQPVDIALTQLYVWSVAKFFLTCALPQTEVSMKGTRGTDESGNTMYVFIVSAPNISNAEEYVQTLTTQENKGAFDQSAVFSKLINETATVLRVSVRPQAEAGVLTITSIFR